MPRLSKINIDNEALRLLKNVAHPVNELQHLNSLIEKIADSRVVMLGEASHGTHEFYTWRAYITKKLIAEKGFSFVAVEGDWPDCYEINRYIKEQTAHQSSAQVLKSFERWPTWMWANWEVAALAEWMRHYNNNRDNNDKAAFYGLDVYSLWDSLQAIMDYLAKVDPLTLQTAKEAISCFAPYGKDETAYAMATRMVPEICEDEVVKLLAEIRTNIPRYDSGRDNVFSTEQNALIAVNAEKYYRAMVRSDADSWNVRDMHMFETLQRLLNFHGHQSKAIVWAHNTHIGDSSVTDMADDGMYNIGELARKFYSGETALVGFGTYSGTVLAGKGWGSEMKEMNLPAAQEASWEEYLHLAGTGNKWLWMNDLENSILNEQRIGHRAVGVVYRPEYERYGNYVPSVVTKRYDAFIYIDQTKALHAMNTQPGTQMPGVPETYPFGI